MNSNRLKTTGVKTRLLGHRGARGEAFENSRQGFEHLIALARISQGSIIGVEFDVQMTRDNSLIIFHDECLTRLFKQQARIDQLTYQQLVNRLGVENGYMLLEHMPNLLNEFSHVELEIKTNARTNHMQLLLSLSAILNRSEFKSLPITLTSFDTQLLNLMKAYPLLSRYKKGLLVEPIKHYTSSTCTGPNTNYAKFYPHSNEHVNTSLYNHRFSKDQLQLARYLLNLPRLARHLDCEHIGLHHSLYDTEIVELCRRLRLSTSAWTVNTQQDVQRLMSLAVDNIITDYPSKMLSLYK